MRKPQAQVTHLRSCFTVIALDQAQHHAIEQSAGFRTIGQRLGSYYPGGLTRAALSGPKVGWMGFFIASQRLRLLVLSEQGHSRNAFASQQGFQILNQGKTSTLQRVGCIMGAQLRLLHKAMHSAFHTSQ